MGHGDRAQAAAAEDERAFGVGLRRHQKKAAEGRQRAIAAEDQGQAEEHQRRQVAAAEFVAPGRAPRLAAMVAALALVLAQGLILREARAVAAWSVPAMPLVFVQGALVAGAGTLVVIALARGAPFDPALIGGVIALLPFAALVWLGYVTSWDGAFAEATKALRERPGFVIVGGGYVAPLVLFGLALALGGDRTLASLGGALLVATQAYAKAMLILRCGRLRPITVPHLRLSRTCEPRDARVAAGTSVPRRALQ